MKMWSSSSPRVARHEQRGHDHAIEHIGGMLEQQRRLVDETPKSSPRWDDYRAHLTVLVWAYDGLVQESTDEFGTDPAAYIKDGDQLSPAEEERLYVCAQQTWVETLALVRLWFSGDRPLIADQIAQRPSVS